MSSNSYTAWNEKWTSRYKSGWIQNKGKYLLLRRLFPSLALKIAPRKKYYRGVARLIEGTFCDLGCGMGTVVGLYSLYSGKKSFGVDQSLSAMKLATAETRYFGVSCAFTASSIYETGIKSASFDTAYMGQILEHLDDEMGALNEAVRLIRNGGKLIVSVPREDRIPDPDHVREYTESSLNALLERLNVGKISFHDIDPRRFVVSCRVGK
ncbi:MAG: class I SAM-dependent methyltransferase [bacterium]|nr:class I SAM-dependent methyltransferase [bacterium]